MLGQSPQTPLYCKQYQYLANNRFYPRSTSCIYGRQAKMPLEVMYGSPQLTQSHYSAQLKQSLEDAYTQVRERMGFQLDRHKKQYDEKVHGKPFERGDRVWLHCTAAVAGNCTPHGKGRSGLHQTLRGQLPNSKHQETLQKNDRSLQPT